MTEAVVGNGNVDLVPGACLTEMGNRVVRLDVDGWTVKLLHEGGIPVHEPGLDKPPKRYAAVGCLQFAAVIVSRFGHGS